MAKDVKIQVEFNPAQVDAYRLIGYENRMLEARDFNDDRKDAGEIGAGHTVTALYEVVPKGATSMELPEVDGLKYQQRTSEAVPSSHELLTVKLRYKAPAGTQSTKLEIPFRDAEDDLATASEDLRFAAAVAAFGMLLRESEHVGNVSYEDVLALARSGLGRDVGSYRAEFLRLVEVARTLQQGLEPNSEQPAFRARRLLARAQPADRTRVAARLSSAGTLAAATLTR